MRCTCDYCLWCGDLSTCDYCLHHAMDEDPPGGCNPYSDLPY